MGAYGALLQARIVLCSSVHAGWDPTSRNALTIIFEGLSEKIPQTWDLLQ